mgnify:CR=1 FL=1
MRAIKLFLLLLISFNFFGCKEDAKVVEDTNVEPVITTYYLIRHAEKDRNDPENLDPELNQDGLGSTNPGASSTAASNTTVASGTFIKIVGSGFVTPEALVLSGTGIANRGALFNIGGKNTLSSAITLNSDATIFNK